MAELPAWVWRRAGRRGRIAAGVVLLCVIAAAVALAPEVLESKRERAESERREQAERRAERVRRLILEQRPRVRRSRSVAPAGASAGERLAARSRLMRELDTAILADARRRVRGGALDGPILRTECEAFPRTVAGAGADRDLERRRGRYACLAVTAEIPRSELSVGGVIGHQYRALVEFETGRYAFCKISGRPEPTPDPEATVPRACGGR